MWEVSLYEYVFFSNSEAEQAPEQVPEEVLEPHSGGGSGAGSADKGLGGRKVREEVTEEVPEEFCSRLWRRFQSRFWRRFRSRFRGKVPEKGLGRGDDQMTFRSSAAMSAVMFVEARKHVRCPEAMLQLVEAAVPCMNPSRKLWISLFGSTAPQARRGLATLREAAAESSKELFAREPGHWSEEAIKDGISRLEACRTALKCRHHLERYGLVPECRKSPGTTERFLVPCKQDAKGCAARLARWLSQAGGVQRIALQQNMGRAPTSCSKPCCVRDRFATQRIE